MRLPHALIAAAAALLVAGALGCDDTREAGPQSAAAPVALADQEDPVCGMLVREQTAPRAQVVHRDGTRFALCSLADLLVHLAAPSRHGEVTDVFVEVLAPDEDPGEQHVAPHPWVAAAEASYVVGVARPGIMGPAILSYRDPDAAVAVASAHAGAQRLDFEALRRWWRER